MISTLVPNRLALVATTQCGSPTSCYSFRPRRYHAVWSLFVPCHPYLSLAIPIHPSVSLSTSTFSHCIPGEPISSSFPNSEADHRITDLVAVPPPELVRPSKHIPEQGVMVVKAVHGIIMPAVLIKLWTTRHATPIFGHLDNLGKRAWSGI